jgi:DNA-binding response OmpR family regulator
MLTNKILLIDDDPEEFDIFCETVAKVDKSIDCVQAFNCKDGFQKLDDSQGLPRYIFLDLNMPPSHGKYCLERIKNHPLYSSIPVFIYTTSNREVDIEETKKLGAQLFFTKPHNFQELKKLVSYVISEEWKYR